MAIKAWRSGETARTWSDDPYNESYNNRNGTLNFSFSMPSKGGGTTEAEYRVGPDNFEEITRAMMTLDEDAAIRAFGAALQAKKPRSS